MKVTLQTSVLAGALEASAKNLAGAGYRPTLVGVLVDCINTEDIVIASTDGSILLAHSFKANEDDIMPPEPVQLIIPRATVELAIKAKRAYVVLEEDTREGSTKFFLGDFLFEPLEGKFPDYNRVIPSTVNLENAHYDIEVLKRAHSAVAKACGVKPTATVLFQNGDNASGVVQGVDPLTICVIMPYRIAHIGDVTTYRGWVKPRSQEERLAA